MKNHGPKTAAQNLKFMSVNHLSERKGGVFLLLFLTFFSLTLYAAPPRRGFDDDSSTREMRDSIESLRHELENHETEIRMAEERVDNQEATISALRQQVLDANQSNKDLLKGSSANWDGRVVNIETANKGFVADLRQLKTHANETTEALNQYKQRIAELEKVISQQSQNIESLQAALRSLSDVLLTKEGSSVNSTASFSESGKTYRVKAGDSLEKIAKNNGTTVRAIKELNNLSNDKIVIGQALQLP